MKHIVFTVLIGFSLIVDSAKAASLTLFESQPLREPVTESRDSIGVTSVRSSHRLDNLEYRLLVQAILKPEIELPTLILPAVGNDFASLLEFDIQLVSRSNDGKWLLAGSQVGSDLVTLEMTITESDGLNLIIRDNIGSLTVLQESEQIYSLRSVVGFPSIERKGETDGISFANVAKNRELQRSKNLFTAPSSLSVPSDPSDQVDLLVVINGAAAVQAGGESLLYQSIELAVVATNQSFLQSDVDLNINFLGMELINYVEANDVATDWYRLIDSSDGYLDEVQLLRDQHEADLVMLVVANSNVFCGFGGYGTNGTQLVPEYGFSVITEYCVQTTTFAHELGHNFGLQHDRFINNSGGVFPYAHGYTAPSDSWYTIMAYRDGCNFNCTPLNRWSNPAQQLNGEDLGVPVGDPNAADNVTALSITQADVANFRIKTSQTSEIELIQSCLAGRGRVDLNIVNTQTTSSVYALEFGSLTARQTTVFFEDWGRLSVAGRLPNTYPAVVKRDGVEILNTNVTIDCSAALPLVSTPEVTITSACRGSTANKGQVYFQLVNPTASAKTYVIEFENVPNRAKSAAAFGQARRGTAGRPDGTYDYLVRTGSTELDSGQVTVDCI